MSKFRLTTLVLLGACSAPAFSIEVAPDDLTVSLDIAVDGRAVANLDIPVMSSDPDINQSTGLISLPGPSGVQISAQVEYKLDPFVFTTLTATNTTSAAKTFTLNSIVPTGPISGPMLIGGSTIYQMTDLAPNDGTGLFASNSPTGSIFSGQIDGVSALDLFTGLSVQCFTEGCVEQASDFQGVPGAVDTSTTRPVGATIPFAGNIANGIGVQHNFTLGAGDSITIKSYFEVTPVPLPSAVWMLGTGIMGFLFSRPRRAA